MKKESSASYRGRILHLHLSKWATSPDACCNSCKQCEFCLEAVLTFPAAAHAGPLNAATVTQVRDYRLLLRTGETDMSPNSPNRMQTPVWIKFPLSFLQLTLNKENETLTEPIFPSVKLKKHLSICYLVICKSQPATESRQKRYPAKHIALKNCFERNHHPHPSPITSWKNPVPHVLFMYGLYILYWHGSNKATKILKNWRQLMEGKRLSLSSWSLSVSVPELFIYLLHLVLLKFMQFPD